MFPPIIAALFAVGAISPSRCFTTSDALADSNIKIRSLHSVPDIAGEGNIRSVEVQSNEQGSDIDSIDKDEQNYFGKASKRVAANSCQNCPQCPTGPPGPAGPAGEKGRPGRDGRDGRDGREAMCSVPVTNGSGGSEGSGGHPPHHPPPTFNGSLPGVTYVRWGRKSCPEHSRLVYDGVMGGSYYSYKGSGSNYLCLPRNPKFGPNSGTTGGAYIYGVEYNTNLPGVTNIINSEAPCAVCQAPGRQNALVIPATNECTGKEWSLEYHGYMMSSSYTHNRAEYICVDGKAEGIPRSSYSNEDSSLYVVEARCSSSGGGLPCPPYSTGMDLLCAVCTQ